MAAARSGAANAPRLAKPSTPDRPRFGLSGPSRPLDLTHNAARRDLADVRLAGRWFAPHYAEPERWTTKQRVPLYETPIADGAVLAELAARETFSVLEISGDWAWGFREADRRVGYVRADGLLLARQAP